MSKSTEFIIRETVAIRAYAEPDFRRSLLDNPRGTIEGAFQTRLPENMSVRVVEDTDTELTLVIPPAATEELSEEELAMAAGGIASINGLIDLSSYLASKVGALRHVKINVADALKPAIQNPIPRS